MLVSQSGRALDSDDEWTLARQISEGSETIKSFYEQRSLQLQQQLRQMTKHVRPTSQPGDIWRLGDSLAQPTRPESASKQALGRGSGAIATAPSHVGSTPVAATEDSGRESLTSWPSDSPVGWKGASRRQPPPAARLQVSATANSRQGYSGSRDSSAVPTVIPVNTVSNWLWGGDSADAIGDSSSSLLSASLLSDVFSSGRSSSASSTGDGGATTPRAASAAAAGPVASLVGTGSRRRNGSGSLDSAASRRKRGHSAVEWLARHPSNGYIRVYSSSVTSAAEAAVTTTAAAAAAAVSAQPSVSWLVACSAATEAHAVCNGLGLPATALHVQLNGGVIRRLDAFEKPLAIQNSYLCKIGHTDPLRIQLEGLSEDLQYLVKFLAGKPHDYGTYGRRGSVSAVLDVKFTGVLQRWSKRLCALNGTKLTVYKDRTKQTVVVALQMAKGKIEEASSKGHERCLKVTASPSEKGIYIAFDDQESYTKWHKKLKKATAKSQLSADLSDCNLEFLPEAVFNNEDLTILNLRRNNLQHRPIEEDIYTIGWLEDLARFNQLQSLNLADNSLEVFPQSVCEIRTLVELNLASNKIANIPPSIAQLTNLQALHLHNNWLSSVPTEIAALSRLSVLVLAFNKFRHIPAPVAALLDGRVAACEVLVMAGNEVDSISADMVMRLRNAAKIDLRMNRLVLPAAETVRFGQLERLTHIDVRDNCISDLDLRAVRTLEYVNVERNGMRSLWLCGLRLKTLLAASNELQRMVMSPKPEWLETLDVSRNGFEVLPSWLASCLLLTVLRASHNKLSELPDRLLTDCKRLRVLRADHNRLSSLGGSELSSLGSSLEELAVHSNHLQSLPRDLLVKCSRLRMINASSNRLTHLPEPCTAVDGCRVQELYLSCNRLGDDCFSVLASCERLRVLHLAYNDIGSVAESGFSELSLLQEVNLSGNHLQSLPASLCRLPELRVLRAHSNPLTDLPSFKDSRSLVVLELGGSSVDNDAVAASFRGLLECSTGANDDCGNGGCAVGIDRAGSGGRVDDDVVVADGLSYRSASGVGLRSGCEYGFTETAGNRNRLCAASICDLPYRDRDEALFGVIDGGRNEEIASAVKGILPQAINEELEKGELRYQDEPCENLRHAFLATHRNLQLTGQKLGASAAVCWIRRRRGASSSGDSDEAAAASSGYTLEVANCGDVGAVLCRGDGEPIVLTRSHTVGEDVLETWRVFQDDGIITEDGKVDGVSRVTRCLGCSYLYPHVLPDPWVSELPLLPQDRFLIVANAALWRYMTYSEAVAIAQPALGGSGGGSLRAARLLRDVAQSYGCSENIVVVVAQFDGTLAAAAPASRGGSVTSLPRQLSAAGNGRLGPGRSCDDYQNVDELVARSLQPPAPQLCHVKKRPMPEPRISLKRMYDSCKLSSLYSPADYVDLGSLAAAGHTTGRGPPRSSAVASASGDMATPPPSPLRTAGSDAASAAAVAKNGGAPSSSASSVSSSGSSKTLTGSSSGRSSSTSSSGDNNSCMSCDAWNGKERSRERRMRESADRPYGSDTLLQYPSDVEFQPGGEYFNRPPMAASSAESCFTEADDSASEGSLPPSLAASSSRLRAGRGSRGGDSVGGSTETLLDEGPATAAASTALSGHSSAAAAAWENDNRFARGGGGSGARREAAASAAAGRADSQGTAAGRLSPVVFPASLSASEQLAHATLAARSPASGGSGSRDAEAEVHHAMLTFTAREVWGSGGCDDSAVGDDDDSLLYASRRPAGRGGSSSGSFGPRLRDAGREAPPPPPPLLPPPLLPPPLTPSGGATRQVAVAQAAVGRDMSRPWRALSGSEV